MSSLPPIFVSSDLFPITIKYVEKDDGSGGSTIIVLKDPKKEGKAKALGLQIKELHTQWKHPTWEEHADALRECQIFDPYSGEQKTDWAKFRMLSMERFLRKWDVADDEGKLVECTKDNMMQLNLHIASALSDEFLKKISPSENDLGN